MALKNLFGEIGLESTLQKIAVYLAEIAQNIGRMYPDTSGRMRVNIETGTLTTVTTLTNASQIGGVNASYDQYCQMQMTVNSSIRNQISIS